jgi:hypothetical protein
VNKADPNDIVLAFAAATHDALADWRTIDSALLPEGIRLRRKAAADSFLALAVSWESFMSRWLIAAANRDSSQVVATLSTKVRDYAKDELRIPQQHIANLAVTRSHFTVGEIRRLLDPKEYNIAVRNRQELKRLSESWLSGAYRTAALAISDYQFRPALITRVLRNALAHQSSAALAEANDVVALTSTPTQLRWTGARRLDVDGWRRNLLTTTAPTPRIETIHNALILLAGRLTVP